MHTKEFYNALARDDLARNGWEILGDTFRPWWIFTISSRGIAEDFKMGFSARHFLSSFLLG